MITKSSFRQRRMDVRLVADKLKGGYFIIAFQRPFRAGNNDRTPMVTTHDIHCDSP